MSAPQPVAEPGPQPAPADGGLAAVLQALGIDFGMERSMKLRRGEACAERVLLSFARAGSPAAGEDGFRGFAASLGMPADLVDEAAAHLRHADLVHLGHEADRRGTYRKLYLEFAGAFRAARDEARRQRRSLPVYVAWKWDPARPERRAVTRYVAPPVAGTGGIAASLARLFPGEPGHPGLRLGLDLLAEAARRSGEAPMLLLVREATTPRLSYDLNLYPAGLTLADAAAPLRPLLVRFGLEAEGEALLARDGAAALGHVAAGAGREGEDFATLYFGAEAR